MFLTPCTTNIEANSSMQKVFSPYFLDISLILLYESPTCLHWANPDCSEDSGVISHFRHVRFLTSRIIYNRKLVLISVVQRHTDSWLSEIPFAAEGESKWVCYHTQLFPQLWRNWTGIFSTEQPNAWGREMLWVLVSQGTLVSSGLWHSPYKEWVHPLGQTPVIQPRSHFPREKERSYCLTWSIIAYGFSKSTFLQWKIFCQEHHVSS